MSTSKMRRTMATWSRTKISSRRNLKTTTSKVRNWNPNRKTHRMKERSLKKVLVMRLKRRRVRRKKKSFNRTMLR